MGWRVLSSKGWTFRPPRCRAQLFLTLSLTLLLGLRGGAGETRYLWRCRGACGGRGARRLPSCGVSVGEAKAAKSLGIGGREGKKVKPAGDAVGFTNAPAPQLVDQCAGVAQEGLACIRRHPPSRNNSIRRGGVRSGGRGVGGTTPDDRAVLSARRPMPTTGGSPEAAQDGSVPSAVRRAVRCARALVHVVPAGSRAVRAASPGSGGQRWRACSRRRRRAGRPMVRHGLRREPGRGEGHDVVPRCRRRRGAVVGR